MLTRLNTLQNTAYVVTEGAKQKNEQWDPAENGQMVIGESARSAINHAGRDQLRRATCWSEAPHVDLCSPSQLTHQILFLRQLGLE